MKPKKIMVVIKLPKARYQINEHLVNATNLLVAALTELRKYPQENNVVEEQVNNLLALISLQIGDNFVDFIKKKHNLN